ncbi:MAG: tetratricopeptide repeat protein, partial [Planctomycetota bacterium]
KAALEKLSEKPEAEEQVKKDKPEPKKKSDTADVTKPSSTDAAELLKRAEEYYRNEQYEPATNVLKRIIRNFPDSEEAGRAKRLLEKIIEEEG